MRLQCTFAATVMAGASLIAPAPASGAPGPCRGVLVGVSSDNRMHAFDITDGAITAHRLSAPLRFKVRNQGVYAAEGDLNASAIYTRATTRDGVPRSLRIARTEADKTNLTVTSSRFAQRGVTPKLFTASYGFHAFQYSRTTLSRVTTFHKKGRPHRLFFADPVRLHTSLRLKSVAYLTRTKLGGVRQDVLYATTRRGGLMVIKVPVNKPLRATFKLVKRSGFGRYTGLSLASCGTDLGILGVDARNNHARWYSVANFYNPKARHVTPLMRVDPSADLRVRAIF